MPVNWTACLASYGDYEGIRKSKGLQSHMQIGTARRDSRHKVTSTQYGEARCTIPHIGSLPELKDALVLECIFNPCALDML